MDNTQSFKNRIYWKIYIVWFLRRIVPLMAVQLLFFGLMLKIFAKNVFVSSVFKNAALAADSGYWVFFKYLVVSFLSTRPLVQVVVLIGLGIVALIIRDISRSLFAYKAMWFKK